MAQEQKCFLRFDVPSIDDGVAIAIEEEHKACTIETIIDELASEHMKAGRNVEAKSILAFKDQDLVVNGQAISKNAKIGDLPFKLETTKNGRVLFARIDVDTTHVMG